MNLSFSKTENPAADQPVPAPLDAPDRLLDGPVEFPGELASDEASGPQFYRRAMAHFLFSFARDPEIPSIDES